MSTSPLGTLDELPRLYRDNLSKANLVPLWPALRSFLPYGMPERKCAPIIWHYGQVRPLLLQAGDLAPIEKANMVRSRTRLHADQTNRQVRKATLKLR